MQAATATDLDLSRALKQYFGYDAFREGQQRIIETILAGQDCFVVMPTGAGKSLCYQLPAIVMPGTALVVSPLIALMKNQVDQMTSLGIEAAYLNSSMSRPDYERVKERAADGSLQLLYVAPETLVRDEFGELVQRMKISFVAVDEAHCISEWGHDFRPEYRRIRPMLAQYGHFPVVALTATATPKVQLDIQHNLHIQDAPLFLSSFNRTNLYYEIRPKVNPVQDIVRYIKGQGKKSGILYCLSRRKVEEMSQILNVNGIHAVPYHAGLDGETRARHQDMFLNEEVQVVVATIAFGMGIDKPDVRFVIHYDVPKSIESYYQETGRGGRDGLEGNCILFYDFNDIVKLEKFMKDKPLSEREAGKHLLYEMAAFCESGICRRKQVLHYFGEHFDAHNCHGMCDNCRHPKPSFDGTGEATTIMALVRDTDGRFGMSHLINVLRGSHAEAIKLMGHEQLAQHGAGIHLEEKAWKSYFTQLLVRDYLIKDIADYGVIKLSEKGRGWLQNPQPLQLIHYEDPQVRAAREAEATAQLEKGKHYDEVLFGLLMDLRKQVAQMHNLAPYVIFQEPSLEEMAVKYPITVKELENVHGVGQGKAARYGEPFAKLIAEYVEEHDIQRPEDVLVKTQGKNSADKLYIIQQIDRKTPLDTIAEQRGMSYETLLDTLGHIVHSGSRVNLGYYINQVVDPDKQEELYDYFRSTDTDDVETAHKRLGGDYTLEEIHLIRAKFYSEFAI